MGRDDGFPIADVAVGLLDDDKVRKLWRLLGDQGAMCEAMTTHEAVLLASWGSGRRVTIDEAVPLWLVPTPRVVDGLVTVGLLDSGLRVPAKAWRAWYGPAAARRKARVDAGRLGGLAKGKGRNSNAKAELYPTGRQAGPSSPAVPDRPKRARAPSGEGGGARGEGPTSLRDAIAGTAFAAEHGLDR